MKNLLLFCLLLVSGIAQAEVCDFNADTFVDQRDIASMTKDRGAYLAVDDPRDLDHDGRLTKLDVKACMRLCDLPGCALVTP